MTVVLLAAKDRATGNLDAGINASALSILLEAGDGANFPQPYTGSASSTGSGTTLNDTGDLASLAVGDFIRNVTDGSWAFVTATGANSITTTQLKGGSDNTWTSGDVWRSGEFVVTLAKIDVDGNDTQYEEVLISNRSTDTLTVPSGGRGYNGTTAQSFDAGDYVQLRVSAPYHEEYRKLLKELSQRVDTNTTDVDNVESGASFYVAAGGSSNAYTGTWSPVPAYAAGLRLSFKANHTNTGASTLNANGLGAVAIKKVDGATALASGDIQNGQIVEVEHDGTNFQMISPLGQTPATPTFQLKYTNTSDSNDISSDTSAADWNTNYTVDASDANSKFAVGVGYIVEAWGVLNGGTSTRRPTIALHFGSVVLGTFNYIDAPNASLPFYVRLAVVCRSVGASGTVQVTGILNIGLASAANPLVSTGVAHHIIAPTTVTIDTTTSAILKLTNYWSVNDGSGKSSILKNVLITRSATS